jgi:hypothetical protein
MFVSPNGVSEITNIFHGFRTHKSAGYESVLKAIAQSLTTIRNASSLVGSFADKMKMTKA